MEENDIQKAENGHEEVGEAIQRDRLKTALLWIPFKKRTILKTRGPRTFPTRPQTLI